jgi:hypothetical protein
MAPSTGACGMSTTFTAESAKALEADISRALDTIAKKHGVTFDFKTPKGFYPYKTGVMTLTAHKPNPYADDYLKNASKFGLDVSWIGQRFSEGGHFYMIQGFDSEQNSIVANREKNNGDLGAGYRFPVEFIKTVEKSKTTA